MAAARFASTEQAGIARWHHERQDIQGITPLTYVGAGSDASHLLLGLLGQN